MFRTRIGGTRIGVRVRSKGCDHRRPGTAGRRLLNIYCTTQTLDSSRLCWRYSSGHRRKPDSGHTDTISITVLVGRTRWNAMKPRIQCVLTPWKPGSSASAFGLRAAFTLAPAAVSSRLLRLARVCSGQLATDRPLRPLTRLGLTSTLAFALALATASEPGAGPGRTPGSDQASRPRQQRSLGSERGLATPSPDGKGEISLGPSVTIMPVDSYSTLGRSCEPAFKWIPDPGQARNRARAARQRQTLAGGWPALGGHEVSCSFTWPGSSPEVQPARSRA
jgi:hypothetical protein